ncbi:MAG: response regulator transcription factor [bacterium]
MTPRRKIIIVDDHPLFREGMRLLIEREGIGEIVAEAKNGQAFLDLLKIHQPDLVVMDVEMPVMDGLEATRLALAMSPGLKILLITMYYEREYHSALINSGAMGFVLKTSGKQKLEKAIRTIISGERYFPGQETDDQYKAKSNTKSI